MAGRLGFSRQKSTDRPYVCVIIDVGMTSRASGTDLKPPTPTAGSRTRPRAASRAPSVLIYALIEYQGGRVVGGTLWYERKPAPAPSRTAGHPRLQPSGAPKPAPPQSASFNVPPWQPQVEVKVVIGSHRPPSDFHERASTSAGFFWTLLGV